MTNYKDTLQLPNTDFPMRASLAQREPAQIAKWDEQDIYKAMIERRRSEGAPKFVLHDGPPYANGNIHHGHILNKTLKDFVVKYKNMSGNLTEFVPGWDCHGLPIEHNVEKQLGEKKHEMTQAAVRKVCREYADKYVGIQREEFKRIMCFGDWENPYKTMSYKYEAATLRELGHFFGKGLVYRGLKPVHWDWASQTALAEAEIEYDSFKTEHVYVKFPFVDAPEELKSAAGGEVFVVIWTTTPWTLPANLAVALNPELKYQLVKNGDEAYVIAEGLREEFLAACKLEGTEVVHEFEGRLLVGELGEGKGLNARHPFIDRNSVLLPADYVTTDQGTGCVHTAPGHGAEDFVLGQEFGLDVINPVDNRGHFYEEQVEHWGGMHVFSANKKIQAYLAETGALLNEVGDKVTIDRYPHGWRSKKPVIFRATTQWFVAIDKENAPGDDAPDLRSEVLAEIDNVNWVPGWGRERIVGMVENRPDWCISRQRTWGVPITVLHCPCGGYLADEKVTLHIADLFEEHGADVWFEREAADLVPEGTTCPDCGAGPEKFTKDSDILDVWFDSGTSWSAVLDGMLDEGGKCDLYLEGSDQHRGWFNSSLTCRVATRGDSPYKTCLTHGFVMDEQGHKYSKSSKNFEPPKKMIDEMGAEILRLWVSAVDYRGDITLSPEIMGRVTDAYRKIRNTVRFLLGNIGDFNPDTDAVPVAEMEEVDRWLLHRTAEALGKVEKAYEEYQFHTIFHTFVQLCTVDLSNVHLDVSKDRMYCSAPDSHERRSGQTAYWLAADALIRAMAPILSFTCEEAWEYLPHTSGAAESVFLTDFPNGYEAWTDESLASTWDRLLAVRSDVQKALEEVRVPRKQKKPGQIGSSQEAHVTVTAEGATYDLLKSYEASLAMLFITSSAEVAEGKPAEGDIGVAVQVADGEKCPRCWNFWIEAGSGDEVCGRCASVIS